MEIVIQGLIRQRLRSRGLISEDITDQTRMTLTDERTIVFADEPDIAVYQQDTIIAAVEVKGGIDTAGVLERIGAAIKSLRRAKEENPGAVTILVLPEVSMTSQSLLDLQSNQATVNHWFTIEDLLENETIRGEVFNLLNI